MKDLYSEILFWGLFLIFNFALFAFNYFIQIRNNRFFPFSYRGVKKGRGGVFISENYDFFRLSIDVSLVILLYRFKILESGLVAFSLVYCFIFLFNLYHFSFAYIYKTTPIIANDVKLLRDGFAILFNESKIKFFGYALGIVILHILVFLAFHSFLDFSLHLKLLPATYYVTLFLIVVFIVAIVRKGVYKNPWELKYRFFIQLTRLIAHVTNSRQMMIRKAKLKENVRAANKKSSNARLIVKPNLHFIFIESYGSLLINDDKVKSRYAGLLKSLSSELHRSNWHIKNNLSESVTLIGPSWLAYSSFLYGCRIDSHLVYEHLLRNKDFHRTDSLLNFLRSNDYISFNLNPTKSNRALNVPMDDLTSFYHVDQWILRDDINYTGLEYGFGEFPADQYTLNYAYENYLKECSSPFVLFYLTKNSHSPYISPKKVLDDWKKLNVNHDKNHSMTGGFLKRPNMDDYLDSIEYQLDVLKRYIVENGKDTDIFLLMGDHQPHELSNDSKHGLETIVHIISKNKDFLRGFENYGFRDSLFDNISPVKHEGFHSAFLRELQKCYGQANGKIPDYEPNGLQLL